MSDRATSVVVMGVSGCGKSTIAQALAQALSLQMMDGDDFHSPQNVSKMSSGVALDDADRWPWLDEIAQYLADGTTTSEGHTGRIVACSALKRAYRDRIRYSLPNIRFVFLDGDSELIRKRMSERTGHFMQLDLLASQLQTLERPTTDERDTVRVSIDQPVQAIVRAASEFVLTAP